MPAPLAVDRSAVHALALQVGVREAARHFGLNENTVMDWSRQGKWLEPLPVKPLPPTVVGPRGPRNPAEATLSAKAKLGEKTWTVQSRAVLKGSRAAAKLPGHAILDRANSLKSLVDSADKLHGWSKQEDQASTLININCTGPAHIQSVASPAPLDVQDI